MSCQSHPDEALFDERYPPAEDLPKSDEYTDPSQAGMYGRSDHDLAIIRSLPVERIWSITEEDGCLYAAPGFHVVNWLWFYVSKVEREEADPTYVHRDYQLTIDDEEDDEGVSLADPDGDSVLVARTT